jgi:hypothetical protein
MERDVRHLEAQAMTDVITQFFNDPLVIPIWGLGVLSVAVMLLTIWRAIEAGQFNVSRLPQLLDTMVLKKLVPLAVLGISAKLVTDGVVSDGLILAYTGGCATVLAAEVKDLVNAVTGQTFPPDFPMTDVP